MKKIYLSGIVLLINFFSFSQGVFTSAGTGNWSAAATWTLISGVDADGVPDADDDVTIAGTNVITVSSLQACEDLTIASPNANRLVLGANTLEINGTLGHGAAPSSDLYITSTSGTGRIKFVGATSRALLTTSAAFGNGFDMEVALSVGAIGTASTNLKYRNLIVSSGTFNNTGDIRIGGTTDGSGTVTVSSGAILILSGFLGARTSSATTYCGNITIDGTLQTSGSRINGFPTINGTLRLRNTLALVSDPSSSFDPEFVYGSSSVVEYNSTTNNSFGAETGRAASTADPVINRILINCGSSSTVSTNFKTTTTNALEFTSGKLAVSASSVFTVTNGANIVGYDNTKYVVTTTGTGKLRINNIGATTITFPVGPTIALYHPVTLNNAGTADNFSVGVTSTPPACCPAATSVSATWDISETIAGGSNCDITLDYTGAATGGSYSTAGAQIAHCAGATSDYHNGSVTGTVASGTGFTTFSPFGVTNDLTVLPLGLTTFDGRKAGSTNTINWKAACSGVGTYTFELQRSNDGRTFKTVTIISADEVRCQQPFSFDDNGFNANAVNYYRLKITDIDGKISYSRIISLVNKSSGIVFNSIMPTVANNTTVLVVSAAKTETISLVITDVNGRTVSQVNRRVVAGTNNIELNVAGLQAGVYMVSGITSTEKTPALRFVKQ